MGANITPLGVLRLILGGCEGRYTLYAAPKVTANRPGTPGSSQIAKCGPTADESSIVTLLLGMDQELLGALGIPRADLQAAAVIGSHIAGGGPTAIGRTIGVGIVRLGLL